MIYVSFTTRPNVYVQLKDTAPDSEYPFLFIRSRVPVGQSKLTVPGTPMSAIQQGWARG